MRCAIYSRVSSEGQNAQSAADQTAACRRFAAAMGWQATEVYEDRALSGANRFRPAFLRLVEDADSRRFDVVLCEALDRLGRRLSDIADLYDKLTFRGIAIHTMQQSPISQMHIGLLGTMSQLFLSDLRHKTHRGLEALARDGRSAGGLCFGYRVSEVAGTASGKAQRGDRAIEPAQAAVVVRIFEQYAAGVSPKRIARMLNAEGIAGPRGGGWSPSAINGNRAKGTGILNNELYVGRLHHFGCSTARNQGPTACANLLTVRRDVQEETVLGALRERLMDPELFKEFAQAFTAEWNRFQVEASAELTSKRQELERVERQLGKLVNALAEGAPVTAVKARMVELEGRKAALTGELGGTEAPAPRLHPNLAEVYRTKVAALIDALNADGAELHEQVQCAVSWVRSSDWRRRPELANAPAVLPGRSLSKSRWMRGPATDVPIL